MALFPEILASIHQLPDLTEDRAQQIQAVIQYLEDKIQATSDIRLVFVCTHNSRRSILSQVWAQSWAHHFGIRNVSCYSAGTETTEVYPRILTTLQSQGFQLQPITKEHNAISLIKFAPNELPILGFSKSLDHFQLPESDFAAIMTCDHAYEHCPLVPGAAARFPLTYQDPKAFDGTPQADDAYHQRSLQIAAEWFYIFHQLTQ